MSFGKGSTSRKFTKSKKFGLCRLPSTETCRKYINPRHSFLCFADDKIQIERIARVRQVCEKNKHLLKKPEYIKQQTFYYASEKYGVSYCKIGKIASTFWTQYFYILRHDVPSVSHILEQGRENIHRIENEENLRIGIKMMTWKTRMVILSARNPYTRLYSAFIDRMFIPSTSKSIRNDEKCKSLISFEEFLINVITNTREGVYDYHWSPVFYICKPCEIKPNILFKQETAKQDVPYIVKKTRMERNKYKVLFSVLESYGNWTAFALAEDVLEYVVPLNMHGPLHCQTWADIVGRLWTALKVQGYIAEEAMFPTELYKSPSDFENANLFRKALVNARNKFPMPKAKGDFQRRKALFSAYKDIDPEVIKGIQDVFRVDFEMFGYSNNPPSWDNNEGF